MRNKKKQQEPRIFLQISMSVWYMLADFAVLLVICVCIAAAIVLAAFFILVLLSVICCIYAELKHKPDEQQEEVELEEEIELEEEELVEVVVQPRYLETHL